MKRILVLHGPNLNLLGQREPDTYGNCTLNELNEQLISVAKGFKFELETFQSNSESELIETIHASIEKGIDAIIINPAAFTHTSAAIRDALCAVAKPFWEVHISNVYAREPFRHFSYFSDKATGVISGLGTYGYTAALNSASQYLK